VYNSISCFENIVYRLTDCDYNMPLVPRFEVMWRSAWYVDSVVMWQSAWYVEICRHVTVSPWYVQVFVVVWRLAWYVEFCRHVTVSLICWALSSCDSQPDMLRSVGQPDMLSFCRHVTVSLICWAMSLSDGQPDMLSFVVMWRYIIELLAIPIGKSLLGIVRISEDAITKLY